MGERINRTNQPLVFVYNANSGLFNALGDMSHKLFSPATYQCHLCALTYSTFGMRQSWKQFLETLDRPLEFLHADELKELYGISNVPLPAVFLKEERRLKPLVNAAEINECRTIDDLKHLLIKRVRDQ